MRGKILKNINGTEFYQEVTILFEKNRVIVLHTESDNVLIDCGVDFYSAEKAKKRIIEIK